MKKTILKKRPDHQEFRKEGTMNILAYTVMTKIDTSIEFQRKNSTATRVEMMNTKFMIYLLMITSIQIMVKSRGKEDHLRWKKLKPPLNNFP